MHSVDFVLEVEHVNEVVVISSQLFLRDSLGKDLCVFVEVQHRLVASWLTVKSVRTCFVNPYPPAFRLVGNLGLLD